MAEHGTSGKFDPAKEDCVSYTKRLQQYFTANDADDPNKQCTILLSPCRPATYQHIRNLVAPRKPTYKTFKEIVDLARKHHHAQPSVIVQRFHFHSQSHREGKSISVFIAELRKLSEHCNFQDMLNNMLRDLLVCGANDSRLKSRLLAETDLTFGNELELTQVLEAAERNAKDLVPPFVVHTCTIHKPACTDGANSSSTSLCYRCGGKHPPTVCNFKDAECHDCGKKGHIVRVCCSKPKHSGMKQLQDHPKQGSRSAP